MSYQMSSMVGSDEEDEDGNLSEILLNSEKSNNEILPLGEVIYLPEDTSCFQPEEEEITDQPVPVRYMKTDVDGEGNSDVKPFADISKKRIGSSDIYKNDNKKICYVDANVKIKKEVIEKSPIVPVVKPSDTGFIENTSSDNKLKSNKDQSNSLLLKPETIKSKNILPKLNENKTSDKMSTLKADALMPPALKRGNSLIQCGTRKSKYTRQATPICDAIMKEYSKRQKLLKNKESTTTADLTDKQIQEILKNAKQTTSESRKNITDTSKVTEITVNKSKNIVTKNNSNEKQKEVEQKDPLFISVKRSEEVKPVIAKTSHNITEIKSVKENIIKQPITQSRGRSQTCFSNASSVVPESKTTVENNNAAQNSVKSSDKLPTRRRERPQRYIDNFNSLPANKTQSTTEDNNAPKDSVESSNKLHIPQRRSRGRPWGSKNKTLVDVPDNNSNSPDVNPEIDNSGEMSDKSSNNSQHMLRRSRRSLKTKDANDPNYNPKKCPKKTRSKTLTTISSNKTCSTELPKNQLANYGTRSKSSTNVKQASSTSNHKELQSKEILTASSFSSDKNHQEMQSTNRVLETDALKPRLKILAERIAGVLNNESSHSIDSEAEKLLQTTQELLKLQKETLQQTSKSAYFLSSQDNILQIKQEETETSKQFDEATSIKNSSNNSGTSQIEMQGSTVTNIKSEDTFSLQSLNEQLMIFDSNMLNVQTTKSTKENIATETYDVQNSRRVDFVNQLHKHHVLLKKHLDKPLNKVPVEVDISHSKNQGVLRTGLLTQQTHMQGKYSFITEFFTSHQVVFTDQLIKDTIPFFSEIVLSCIDNLYECVQRVRSVKKLTPEKLVEPKVKLLSESYISMLQISGEKFFPKFNSVIKTIDKFKTRKALIVTLIFYISSSLDMKSPTYIKQLHRVRRSLIFMSKVQKSYHHLLWQVLEASDQMYEVELKLVIEILKYFHKRKFVSPLIGQLLTKYCHDQSGSFLSTESSHTISHPDKVSQFKNINKAANINPNSFSNIRSQYFVTSETQPSSLACQTSSPLSEITVQFIKALQSERGSNSNRKGENLDHILNVLSANSKFQGDISPAVSPEQQIRVENTIYSDSSVIPNFPINIEKPNESWTFPSLGEKDAGLVQLIKNEYAGLDSLFESYRRDEVQIKSEPIDVNDNSKTSDTVSHDRKNDNSNLVNQVVNNIECTLQPYFVKQEEERSWVDVTNEGKIQSDENSTLSYSSTPSTSYHGPQANNSMFYTKMEDECNIIDTFKQDQVMFIKCEPTDPEHDPLS